MSCSLVVKDCADFLAYVHVIGTGVEAHDRSKLLVGVWMTAAYAGLLCDEHSCILRNAVQMCQRCDRLNALTYDLRIHRAVCTENKAAELRALVHRQGSSRPGAPSPARTASEPCPQSQMTDCSDAQMVPLSNVSDCMIRFTASGRSA